LIRLVFVWELANGIDLAQARETTPFSSSLAPEVAALVESLFSAASSHVLSAIGEKKFTLSEVREISFR
jgi:hypothetical protein